MPSVTPPFIFPEDAIDGKSEASDPAENGKTKRSATRSEASPIVISLYRFSRGLHHLLSCASSSDWLIVLFASPVIGHYNNLAIVLSRLLDHCSVTPNLLLRVTSPTITRTLPDISSTLQVHIHLGNTCKVNGNFAFKLPTAQGHWRFPFSLFTVLWQRLRMALKKRCLFKIQQNMVSENVKKQQTNNMSDLHLSVYGLDEIRHQHPKTPVAAAHSPFMI